MNMPVIIGIDPDSNKHGVAIYVNGKLNRLLSAGLFELFDVIKHLLSEHEVQIHIEDVCQINTTFSKSYVKNSRAQTTVSRSVGMCQQSQKEVERMAEYLCVPVVKHPISKHWKSPKEGNHAMKKLGWNGSSNEDTRSAAYFGYCGVKQWHTLHRKK